MNFNNFSVMILAAGYGKRLRPVTNEIPKSLVEVAGRSLLQNVIDLILNLKCEEIVINTHYKHEMINNFIEKNYKQKNILLSHEKKLLDTGGGVKNALSLFKNKIALIINSDIFWTKENFSDIKNLIDNFEFKQQSKLMLVTKEKAHGIYNNEGDFTILNGLVTRYRKDQKNFFYTGAQIISLDLLKKYKQKKFSFNLVWDDQIQNKSIFADIINSHWYHVGDARGLKEAQDFIS